MTSSPPHHPARTGPAARRTRALLSPPPSPPPPRVRRLPPTSAARLATPSRSSWRDATLARWPRTARPPPHSRHRALHRKHSPPPAATGALVGAEHGRYSPKTPCCNPLEGGTDGARHTPTSFPIPTLSLPVHSPPPARVHSRRRGVSGDGSRGGGRRPGQFDSAFLAETVLIHVCVALKRATRLEGPLFAIFSFPTGFSFFRFRTAEEI